MAVTTRRAIERVGKGTSNMDDFSKTQPTVGNGAQNGAHPQHSANGAQLDANGTAGAQ
jgi:hypothetical protein